LHAVVSQGWDRLLDVGRATAFRRGQYLIMAGSTSEDVLLIEQGVVKAVLVARDGAESVAGFLGAGDLVGEIGVMSGQPRSAHIVALTSGRAIRVSSREFLRMRSEHRDVLRLVDEVWHRRQRQSDERQLALTRDVTSRLAMSLLRWARDLGEPTPGGLLMRGISQRDTAQAIAASEKSVEAALRVLRSAGMVKTWRLTYLIPAPALLEARIGRSGR